MGVQKGSRRGVQKGGPEGGSKRGVHVLYHPVDKSFSDTLIIHIKLFHKTLEAICCC